MSDVDHFRYLGSVLTDKCDLTDEIYRRIGLAAAAFGNLQSRVFSNDNLRPQTKVKVHKAICLSILLYGSEAWVPYRRHVKLLQSFHMRTLRKLLGIRWWQRVTNTEVNMRAGMELFECLLARR